MPIPIENLSEQPVEAVEVSTPQTVPAENATAIESVNPSEPASASAPTPMESLPAEVAPLESALIDPAPVVSQPEPVTAAEHTNGNGFHAPTGITSTPAVSPSSLSGKVALVTGSSRGIGRGIILELAGRGADCVVNYCGNLTAAQSVVKECQALGVRATAVQADVSDVESIKKMYAQAMSYFGHLDIIVSNSGVEHFSTIEETTPEMYDYVMNINTRGQFFVAQQGYLNISHGGRIVMMSSVAANIRGLAHHSIYSASKAAIEAMVRSFPSDFSPKRVTVNAIAPAGIESDMASVNGWRYFPGGTPDMPLDVIAKKLSEACPLKRFGQPKDVARVVAFLASEEGGWINGKCIETANRKRNANSKQVKLLASPVVLGSRLQLIAYHWIVSSQ